MGVRYDWLQWGSLVCCVWLVFLASCTFVDIFFCKFFHPSAFICLAEEMGHVGNARVFYKQVVVIQFQNFAPHIEFIWELNLGKACQW